MKSICLYVALMLICTGCSLNDRQPSTSVSQGSAVSGSSLPAPDEDVKEIIESAVFTDLDGNEVTLAKFRDKVLVIDFWESWCTPCLQLFPKIQELVVEYPDDFAVVAVTLGYLDGPEEARVFQEEHGYDFNFVMDSNKVSKEIGLSGIPYKIYIDPQGEMIKQVVGLDLDVGDFESTKAVIEEFKLN